MGTSYAPYCLDCDSEHYLDDYRDVASLQTVIKQAKSLAALAPLMADLHSTWADAAFYLNHQRDRIDFAWFAKHAEHRLTVRDEYGKCVEECGEYFPCGACGHRKRCMRLAGHDGDHDENRDS
jgi:hypothetical protein